MKQNGNKIYFIGLLFIIGIILLLFSIHKKRSDILYQLRTEQAKADITIQKHKALIYKACTQYKQAQLDRDNLQTRITTIVNSEYEKTQKLPKEKTMEVDKYCKYIVNKMSYTYSIEELGLDIDHQVIKLDGQVLSGNQLKK